jgi:hypothetical protein
MADEKTVDTLTPRVDAVGKITGNAARGRAGSR